MSGIARTAKQLCDALRRLPELGLVTWTSGNISVRLDEHRILIKPSGVHYYLMTPKDMVVVSDDDPSAGWSAYDPEISLKPSTDVWAHWEIYTAFPQVKSIVHTHSPYATAFAAHGWSIRCCLTAIADEFGGEIPCGHYASIGGPEIGQEVVKVLSKRWCPAILMRQHGVFTVGDSIESALRAAVMVEDAAKTTAIAFMIGGGLLPLPLPKSEIDKAHERYTNFYGQR